MNNTISIIVAFSIFCFSANSFAMPAEIPASIPSDSTQAVAKGSTQVTIGGELRVRGTSTQNTSDLNGHSAAIGADATARQVKGK